MWKHPCNPFGVERMGEAIWLQMPRNVVKTGITYRPHLPGVVPEIEERDSARFNGYGWREWQLLDYQDRVDGVAYYRLRRHIEMWEEDAVSRETERRTRRQRHSSV